MKQKLTNISLTFLLIIILGIIFALTTSMLTYFQIISINVNDNIVLILSLFLFFLLGFIFGLIEKKKGLLNGLLLVSIYLLTIFSFKIINQNFTFTSIYIILTRSLLIIIGCIIGVNVKRRKE